MLATTPATFALAPLLAERPTTNPVRGGELPASLAARYGGSLAIPLKSDRPTVVANFVSTLDGVVSYNTPEAAGGGEISGFFEPDRFVMGMLRALADVVLVGAGTVRAAPDQRWTPEFIHPSSADDFAALRDDLGLAPQPTTVVVSASGSLDLNHPGLNDPRIPVAVLTTTRGAAGLRRDRIPRHVEVRDLGASPSPSDLLAALGDGPRLVLCEGGPHLLGQLLAAELVDELFLTMAPQIAGRSAHTPRLSLVEDRAFNLDSAPWVRLVDLRRAADHLFIRYRLTGGSPS
jgi:riboflavin biosynthesis pyrimidine reductase